MSDVAIRVENLSKRYRIGQREPYKAWRDVLTHAFTAPFHRLRLEAEIRRSDPSGAQTMLPEQGIGPGRIQLV